MRLPPNYQKTITDLAAKVFGASASILLFGSRLDDAGKGGDIDLLINLKYPADDKVLRAARYSALLQMHLGMQKFDVIVIDPSTVLQSIHKQALSKGVPL